MKTAFLVDAKIVISYMLEDGRELWADTTALAKTKKRFMDSYTCLETVDMGDGGKGDNDKNTTNGKDAAHFGRTDKCCIWVRRDVLKRDLR